MEPLLGSFFISLNSPDIFESIYSHGSRHILIPPPLPPSVDVELAMP